MVRKLGCLFFLLICFSAAPASGTATTNVWRKAVPEWRHVIDILVCHQADDDTEGFTLFCFGLGCPMAETYQGVIITWMDQVTGPVSVVAGRRTTTLDMLKDDANSRALKWGVSVAPIEGRFLADIQGEAELRIQSGDRDEVAFAMTNYAAELDELLRTCQTK